MDQIEIELLGAVKGDKISVRDVGALLFSLDILAKSEEEKLRIVLDLLETKEKMMRSIKIMFLKISAMNKFVEMTGELMK